MIAEIPTSELNQTALNALFEKLGYSNTCGIEAANWDDNSKRHRDERWVLSELFECSSAVFEVSIMAQGSIALDMLEDRQQNGVVEASPEAF